MEEQGGLQEQYWKLYPGSLNSEYLAWTLLAQAKHVLPDLGLVAAVVLRLHQFHVLFQGGEGPEFGAILVYMSGLQVDT